MSKISHCQEGIIPSQNQFYFRLPFDSQNIENAFVTTSNTNFQWEHVKHSPHQPLSSLTNFYTHFQAPPVFFPHADFTASFSHGEGGNKEKIKAHNQTQHSHQIRQQEKATKGYKYS